jgi:hypothetical protein
MSGWPAPPIAAFAASASACVSGATSEGRNFAAKRPFPTRPRRFVLMYAARFRRAGIPKALSPSRSENRFTLPAPSRRSLCASTIAVGPPPWWYMTTVPSPPSAGQRATKVTS